MNNLEIITLKKKNITDFAKERNLLLKKSDADWILFIDSDEVVTPALLNEINDAINNKKGISGFYIRRKIFFLGECIGTDRVLRLAKKKVGKWKRRVHETWVINGKIGTINNYIVHNTGDNLYKYIAKMNAYSSLHAIETKKEGKDTNLFKIIFYPKFKFIQNVLSGRGIVFSIMQSFHSFLSWSKQWEMSRKTGHVKR